MGKPSCQQLTPEGTSAAFSLLSDLIG